jgi:hypothetical protein
LRKFPGVHEDTAARVRAVGKPNSTTYGSASNPSARAADDRLRDPAERRGGLVLFGYASPPVTCG